MKTDLFQFCKADARDEDKHVDQVDEAGQKIGSRLDWQFLRRRVRDLQLGLERRGDTNKPGNITLQAILTIIISQYITGSSNTYTIDENLEL